MSLFREVQRTRVVGDSEAMRRVEGEAILAARADVNVLIAGETGVGKGVVARFIHEHSARAPFGFAAIKCDGLPDRLFESALFGHVQGSFAGAYRDKAGLLTSLAGGTIFLDEVGALSEPMQALLLRFLETGEFLPIGGGRIQGPVDVRLIASTSANLPAGVTSGLFLGALHRRLREIGVSVPPLRERRGDIPSLVDHFVAQFASHRAPFQSAPELAHTDREAFYRADWPGNVRDLKSAVLRQLLRTAPRAREHSMLQSA